MDSFDIKKYRLTMGISQKSFADLIGITQSAYSKLESGTLGIDKYQDKIQSIVQKWKSERIQILEKELNFIKNL